MVFDVFVVILNNLYVEPLSIASFYKIHQCLSCLAYALTERQIVVTNLIELYIHTYTQLCKRTSQTSMFSLFMV